MSPGYAVVWVYTSVSTLSCLLVIATILICKELRLRSYMVIALMSFTDMTFLTGGYLVLAGQNIAESSTQFCHFQAWYLYTVWLAQVVTFTLFVQYLGDVLLLKNSIIAGKSVSSIIISLCTSFLFIVFHLL